MAAIDVTCYKLSRCITGASAHSAECRIHYNISFILENFNKMNAICKGKLLIIVSMKTKLNRFIQYRIENPDNVIEISRIHRAKSIYNRQGNRLKLIHQSCEFYKIIIRVRKGICSLQQDFITLLAYLSANFNCFIMSAMGEYYSDGIN